MDMLHREVKSLESTLRFELDVIAYMASELALSMPIIDHVLQTELGIESLLQGLTPLLISFDKVVNLLTTATVDLARPRQTMFTDTPGCLRKRRCLCDSA